MKTKTIYIIEESGKKSDEEYLKLLDFSEYPYKVYLPETKTTKEFKTKKEAQLWVIHRLQEESNK